MRNPEVIEYLPAFYIKHGYIFVWCEYLYAPTTLERYEYHTLIQACALQSYA